LNRRDAEAQRNPAGIDLCASAVKIRMLWPRFASPIRAVFSLSLMPTKRIIVAGGSGKAGHWIIRHLLEEGCSAGSKSISSR